MKKQQRDPKFQRAMEIGNIHKWEDPEYRKKHCERTSKQMTRQMKDPEFRAKQAESTRTPENRKRVSKQALELHKDPKFVKKLIAHTKTPKHSKRLRKLWDSPEFYDAMSASHKTTKYRKNSSKRMTKYNQSSEFRKKQRAWHNYSYRGIAMCSSWEVEFARMLTFLGLKWQYEPKSFVNSKGHSYTPDFYVPELKRYFEIKGWNRKRALLRAKAMEKRYGVKIVVLGGKALENLGMWNFKEKPKFTLVKQLKSA